MPKMKTKRGAAKRFSKTGSGKIKFKRSKMRHILTKKSTKFKRNARKAGYVRDCETARINLLIPYK
ncbi:MAG: 50S ribosomal protein L35 [Proteobacteria bacterium]|nr:50S ribosomal protein L35 [Pseudomonadota bacterium]MCP4919127.1 50S ribosomal protein L35 [Pseudomonadota bacterium]